MRNGCWRCGSMILGNGQENILPDGWVRLILTPPSPSARAFLPWDPWFWCWSWDLILLRRSPGFHLDDRVREQRLIPHRCQGSSAVEQGTHKPLVGSSILPSGTNLPPSPTVFEAEHPSRLTSDDRNPRWVSSDARLACFGLSFHRVGGTGPTKTVLSGWRFETGTFELRVAQHRTVR